MYTGALCITPVHVYTDCQTVQMYIILQVFRGSSCNVLPRKFILYSVPTVYAKHFKWQCVIYPDIIAPSPMRGLQARDFHPSGFLFLCLRVSSLSQRPGPELAGVHWIPEHRPSLHIGRAGPSSLRSNIRNLHSLHHRKSQSHQSEAQQVHQHWTHGYIQYKAL